MNDIGLLTDPHSGRAVIERLDAESGEKRKLHQKNTVRQRAADGELTEKQAMALLALIEGSRDADPHARRTPFDEAAETGIITAAQAGAFNRYVGGLTRGETARCTGTAKHLFDSGETLIEHTALSTDLRDDSVVKAAGGAVVRLKNAHITKRGDTTDHCEGSMTGLNAAVLAEGGTVYLEDLTVTSYAVGGNNVFAHGRGSHIHMKNVKLDAYGEASDRCIYVSYGGEVTAEHCDFVSRGNISSTVATDTGGGTIRLKNCVVKNLGHNGAGLYSTGHIIAENCLCLSPECEGLIIVGNNTLDLTNCHVLSGEKQGLKINTREGGGGTLNMTGGLLAVCEGPIVYLSGNPGQVNFNDVQIANPSGLAFVAESGGPQMGPSDGGEGGLTPLTVNLRRQSVRGDSRCDDKHSLTINLKEGSSLTGSVNGANTRVTLDAGARWTLTGDSAVGSLEAAEGAVIDTGGYVLTVADKAGSAHS